MGGVCLEKSVRVSSTPNLAVLKNPEIILSYYLVPNPDFPVSGIIFGKSGDEASQELNFLKL